MSRSPGRKDENGAGEARIRKRKGGGERTGRREREKERSERYSALANDEAHIVRVGLLFYILSTEEIIT